MLEVRNNKEAIIVSINQADRLTAASAEGVKIELTKIVSESKESIVLDLSNIKFIDSTGIGVIISALKTARQNNVSFFLSNVQTDVMSLLKLMKLDKIFDLYTAED